MTQAMYLFDVPQPLPPILTAHLFPEIESKLIELLHSLRPEDWDRQTLAPKWKVRHVVAHLLDTQLRKLTLVRDGYFAVTPQIGSSQDLVNLINRLNAGGVDQYSRLSPQVLISLMETASRQSCDFHASLDPSAPAMFAVSWAGESESQNWFDTARELTERWHHQQQIRDAVGKPGIMLPHLYHPVLDCFLRALPFGYREQHADRDSLVEFKITGDCGGSWYLYRGQKWELISHPEGRPVATAAIPQEIAWRIFTKGISYDDARQQTSFEGDEKLALHILNIIAIVG
jgi:uncharacterized protein (TIGR03083 family)